MLFCKLITAWLINSVYILMVSSDTSRTYTMILLIGMWMSFTKKPMNPMIAKPIAVAMAIFWNSENHNKNMHQKYS